MLSKEDLSSSHSTFSSLTPLYCFKFISNHFLPRGSKEGYTSKHIQVLGRFESLAAGRPRYHFFAGLGWSHSRGPHPDPCSQPPPPSQPLISYQILCACNFPFNYQLGTTSSMETAGHRYTGNCHRTSVRPSEFLYSNIQISIRETREWKPWP